MQRAAKKLHKGRPNAYGFNIKRRTTFPREAVSENNFIIIYKLNFKSKLIFCQVNHEFKEDRNINELIRIYIIEAFGGIICYCTGKGRGDSFRELA